MVANGAFGHGPFDGYNLADLLRGGTPTRPYARPAAKKPREQRLYQQVNRRLGDVNRRTGLV